MAVCLAGILTVGLLGCANTTRETGQRDIFDQSRESLKFKRACQIKIILLCFSATLRAPNLLLMETRSGNTVIHITNYNPLAIKETFKFYSSDLTITFNDRGIVKAYSVDKLQLLTV